jgi:hypothetical protein
VAVSAAPIKRARGPDEKHVANNAPPLDLLPSLRLLSQRARESKRALLSAQRRVLMPAACPFLTLLQRSALRLFFAQSTDLDDSCSFAVFAARVGKIEITSGWTAPKKNGNFHIFHHFDSSSFMLVGVLMINSTVGENKQYFPSITSISIKKN